MTLQYRIDCCLEQAAAIKKEHPNLYFLSFDLTDCKYEDLELFAICNNSNVAIKDCYGVFNHTFSTIDKYPVNCMINFRTKKLLVSQTIQEAEE